jgi:sialidase-1
MSEKKTVAEKGALSRRRFIVTAATGAGVSGASLLTSCKGAATKVEATAAQRVHPLLIRNDHNSLIHVVVEVGQEDVRATSLTFSLRGTDDLGDIENLRLFYSGDKRPPELDKTRNGRCVSGDRKALLAELTATPFGRETKPAAELTFRGNQVLRPGINVFWLSCKLRPTADLSHKVGARCTAIETSAGTVAPRDATPRVRKRIGVALRRHYDDGVDTYRIPALTTTPKGTLLSVYDARRRKRRDLQEDIDIGLSRSTDGGRSWEPMRVIMDMGEYGGLPQEQNGCSDPGIVVDQQGGEIFCAAVWMWGKPGKHQWVEDGSEPGYEIGKSAQFMMVRSTDDGRTWSKPENMTRKLKRAEWILLAPSPQAGITLRDGALVMPGEGRDENDRQFSTLIVSRDHGATWTVGSPAVGNNECQVVQLDDDSIMLNARTNRPTKFRSVYVTDDLGRTWQPHSTHRKALIEPNCNGSLCRFDYREEGQPKHVLLFANPHSQTGRDHHSIQISFDEGRTWPEKYRLLLDEGRGNGYPSITRVDDRHVGIVYEGSQANLVFEKLSLDELLRKG